MIARLIPSLAFAAAALVNVAGHPIPSPTQAHAADLQSSVPAVRANAAAALGRAGEKSVVPALIVTLKDSEKSVRCAAAKALGSLRASRAVPALANALADNNNNVRFYAAHALGEIADPKATDALLTALCDLEWCVRDEAAWALRQIGDASITIPLAAMLKEKNAPVAHIVWLLQQTGGKQSVGPLAALLVDRETETRMRAVSALSELRVPPGIDPLVSALKDSDAGIRRAAVEGLLRIGGERIEQPLTELLAREQDPGVHAIAEKAVAKMTRSEALAAHWSFDDKSTTVANDISGRAADGEIKGCTVADGKVGAALRFGKGKFIELGRATKPSVAKTPFTIMAWIKADAPTGVVVARGGAACGFSLYIKDGLPKFGIRRSQTTAADVVAGREKVGSDWTHLAGVVHEDRLELYVNGKLAGTTKCGGLLPGNGGQGMEIGFDVGNSAVEITDAFEGVIDEVKQFDASLSEKEIARQCQ
ncbi:MAG: HEAT repeat domain-containing protein [Verrucomicrobia bacterium]|nr:HEAT repeat domain-containing protein [Verrucomicrobiota bacterium]